ncbi:hypothetical protein AVEN_93949-1 [Araneus ventricosus]|uniref:Uncharacterized protein n=1 Tax=Araneus ventricosus TaxID=182803 RepID=A0A4Y2CML7_ARAVE|nr:hypothetical protein AVEN_93949-1 [Araneus ventricosus]
MVDSTLLRWVSSCPINMNFGSLGGFFCENSFVSLEQHVEFWPSRKSRNDSDLVKLSNWLSLHNLLNVICPKHLLINIAIEFDADDKTNCDSGKDVGEKFLSSIAGGSFGELKLLREKRVIAISATSNTSIIRNESVVFNPLQLFTRIAAVFKSNENLRDHLKYELAPQPPSLFEGVSSRKNAKSTLAAIIE